MVPIMKKLTRKLQMKQKSYNSQAVCITEDEFFGKLLKKIRGKTKTRRGGAKERKKKGNTSKPTTGKEPTTQKATKPTATRTQHGSCTDEDGDEVKDESDCECPICGEHFGDRSTTWIQCNVCEEWYDTECAGVSDLPDE